MRVVATVHFAYPWRGAGSETVLHELLKAAQGAGHDVTLWCTNQDAVKSWRGNEPVTEFDGIETHRSRNILVAAAEAARLRPDVWISHHQHVLHSIRTAKRVGARSVYAIHNDMDINRRPLALRPDLVLFNSEWVKESLSRFTPPKESLTFHPPLTPDRHQVAHTGDAITLVNLNEHKGALIFYELAARMPHQRFLGVIGGHGEQIIRRGLPNVTIMDHGPDMKRVWKQTRVLLMPSVYESYGLVAVEAGLNGIPTIANPTPGLMENLGERGLFVDRENTEGWVDEITRLDDPDNYGPSSAYARARATLALESTRDTLKQWVDWIG